MFPVALRFGDLTITWYGVLVAAGFLLAVRWGTVHARRNGLSGELVERLSFWIIVTAVIGSRLLYVLTELPTYLTSPVRIFDPREGGLVFLGGLAGALVCAVVFLRSRKQSFWRYADVMLPTVALGHAFGRLGCYAVGCCYGKPAPELPWAITFPVSTWEQIAPVGVPLHPVQLYAVALNAALFVTLTAAYRWRRFDGQMALLYLGMYALGRMLLELVRGDAARGFVLEDRWGPLVSTGQVTSAILLVTAVVLYAWRRRGQSSTGSSAAVG
jgi:phosphatidylglycerol---prolipoprotein diacylglyceryl transferase